MIKRTLFCLALSVVGLALMIGVEVLIAMRREYLPTEPALQITGRFGPPEEPVTIVVMGDSTAAGVGAGSVEASYPYRLAQRISESTGLAIELFSVGESGARVADVRADQIAPALFTGAHMVLIVIGANDATHLTGLGGLKEDMELVVDRMQATGAPVIVAGAPDMRAPAFYEPLRSVVGWRGRAVTAAIEEAARARGATVVPLAERTRDFFREHPDRAYSSDEFHPGPEGYDVWVDALFPEVAEAVESVPGFD